MFQLPLSVSVPVLLLLHLNPGASSIAPNTLVIMNQLVSEMQLKSAVLVMDQSVRKLFSTEIKMQIQVVISSDLEKMKNLHKMDKCGVFVHFENEDDISSYLQEVKRINNDEDIFKKLHWFIFSTREDGIDIIFKFNSKVFVLKEEEEEHAITIYETYSIHQSSKIIQIVGQWTKENGLEIPETNYLKRRPNLMGLTLKTIYYNDPGLCEVLEPTLLHNNPRNLNWDEHNWSGQVPDLFNSLAEMLNFTYTLQFSRDGGWGSIDKNGSWNGGVRDILDGVADLGGGFFTASYIRRTVVDFTLPLLESVNTFFLKNPKAAFSWTSYVRPFSLSTWYVLVCMIIICTLSLASLAQIAEEKNIKEFGLRKSFIYSFGAYCALAARRWSVTPVNIAVRIAFITILLCGCLIFWHWKAGLISNLSVVRYNPPFSSMEELMNSNYKVTLLGGSSYENTFKFGKSSVLKNLWNTKVLPYKDNFYKLKQDGINLILEDSSYVQFDSINAIKTFPEYRNCDVMDIKIPITIDRLAFALPKGGQFNELLDFALKKIIETGEMGKLRIKWASPDQSCGGGKGRTLGFENTMPGFLIFITGFTLCIFGLLLELVYKKLWVQRQAEKSSAKLTQGPDKDCYYLTQPHKGEGCKN